MVETIQADIDYSSDPGLINRQSGFDQLLQDLSSP